MFRTARRIAPLLHHLAFGGLVVGCVASATTVLVGCADENDPETYVKRLNDPAQRTSAVQRLIQFFDDAMTKDNKDRNGPNVKPLLDTIVQPLSETCVAGDLDPRTNTALIKFVGDTRDPRGANCLIKALKDYKPDSTEEDVRAAVRAIGAMKLKEAAGPLLDVFKKVHASKPKAGIITVDVHDAMLKLEDPSWQGDLITYLGRPVDQKDQAQATDELYWQTTAAEVLGRLKAAAAVKPLIKIVLSPEKAYAQTSAVLALVKIGKPAIGPAVALLKGEDKELVDYSKGEYAKAAAADKSLAKAADTAYIGVAALILATIGRAESAAPLVEALNGKMDDIPRAIIARELVKVPKTPDTVRIFQEITDKTPPGVAIPGQSSGAREALYTQAANFYDPTFVPWLVKSAIGLKGDESDVAPARETALASAMNLMTKEQIGEVKTLVDFKTTDEDHKPSTVGKGYDKEWKLAQALVNECDKNVDCWIGKMSDPNAQSDDKSFQGTKAAFMVGVYGNESTKAKILAALPKMTHPAIRFAAVSVLDYLSPKGDVNVANALQKMVDDAQEKHDDKMIRANGPFSTVIYRLTERAS